jgi:hypothetical protein
MFAEVESCQHLRKGESCSFPNAAAAGAKQSHAKQAKSPGTYSSTRAVFVASLMVGWVQG